MLNHTDAVHTNNRIDTSNVNGIDLLFTTCMLTNNDMLTDTKNNNS